MGDQDPHQHKNAQSCVKENAVVFSVESVERKSEKNIYQGKQAPSAYLEKPIPLIL